MPIDSRRLEKVPTRGHTLRTNFSMRIPSHLISPTLCRIALACLVVLGSTLFVYGQDVEDVISTSTSLVQLNIGVVDKQGHPITSLTRNDFTIYEDGVKQTIQRFEPVEAPFSLVIPARHVGFHN
jgi:hypothetical protein